MEITEILKNLDIKYELVHHKPVYTSKEAEFICNLIDGIECKNLFLTNHHGKYYLVFLNIHSTCDIKSIKKLVHEKNLSFASKEELKEILDLEQGHVTPLAIVNDLENKVTIILDHNLKDKMVLCHLHDNTETISILINDLIRYITYLNHNYVFDNEESMN